MHHGSGYVLERESPEGRAICERSFTGIRQYAPAPQWLNENPGTHPQRVDVDHCGVGLIDLFRSSTAGYRAGECAVTKYSREAGDPVSGATGSMDSLLPDTIKVQPSGVFNTPGGADRIRSGGPPRRRGCGVGVRHHHGIPPAASATADGAPPSVPACQTAANLDLSRNSVLKSVVNAKAALPQR